MGKKLWGHWGLMKETQQSKEHNGAGMKYYVWQINKIQNLKYYKLL